jgi:hypothetical protein
MGQPDQLTVTFERGDKLNCSTPGCDFGAEHPDMPHGRFNGEAGWRTVATVS